MSAPLINNKISKANTHRWGTDRRGSNLGFKPNMPKLPSFSLNPSTAGKTRQLSKRKPTTTSETNRVNDFFCKPKKSLGQVTRDPTFSRHSSAASAGLRSPTSPRNAPPTLESQRRESSQRTRPVGNPKRKHKGDNGRL